ncbi:MAG: helix-turn-helix transcriptional regulator [Clostridia bacterium]|nr:helix-turn-helix transcriptional regulator [Clostridia bacterium]
MDNKIKQIGIDEISPYVRLVSYIETTSEIFYVPWRMIYDYECYYVTEGEIVVKTEDAEVCLRAGDLHVMRPFIWHRRYAKTPNIKYYGIHFDFLRIDRSSDFSTYTEYVVPIKLHKSRVKENSELSSREVYEPTDIILPLKMTVEEQPKYVFLFKNMLEHFRSQKAGNTLLLKADILVLLAYLAQESTVAEPRVSKYRHNAVAQFTQAIADSYNEKIYLSDLSLQMGMSPTHMRKVFHQVNNISPREFLINSRIERAKYYLEEGKLTISEIGTEIGYPNVNYFSRIFKKKTNMSPSEYRKYIYGKNRETADPQFYWCDAANGTAKNEAENGNEKREKRRFTDNHEN